MKIKHDSDEYQTILTGLRKPIDKIGLDECNRILGEMRDRGLTAERIRWDMLHTYVGYRNVNPDGTFTDEHIDTAMKAVCRELGLDLV